MKPGRGDERDEAAEQRERVEVGDDAGAPRESQLAWLATELGPGWREGWP